MTEPENKEVPELDWRELEPIARKLQAGGWTKRDLLLAWKAAARGGVDHLQVSDEAYRRACRSRIGTVHVQWAKHGEPRGEPVVCHLVGLCQKVCQVDVGRSKVFTFSLAHGRAAYGSQRRFEGWVVEADLVRLRGVTGEQNEVERQICVVLKSGDLTMRELCEQLGTAQSTVYHALCRLVERGQLAKLGDQRPWTYHVVRRTKV